MSTNVYQYLFNLFCDVAAVFVMFCFVDDFSAFFAVCSSDLSVWLG